MQLDFLAQNKHAAAALHDADNLADGWITARAGSLQIKCLPENADKYAAALGRLRTMRKPSPKLQKSDVRRYPEFKPGMSTLDYVRRFEQLNSSRCLTRAHTELNAKPATLPAPDTASADTCEDVGASLALQLADIAPADRFVTVTAGRMRLRVRADKAQQHAEALRKAEKPAPKKRARAEYRAFPEYVDGMTTADYVCAYFAANGGFVRNEYGPEQPRAQAQDQATAAPTAPAPGQAQQASAQAIAPPVAEFLPQNTNTPCSGIFGDSTARARLSTAQAELQRMRDALTLTMLQIFKLAGRSDDAAFTSRKVPRHIKQTYALQQQAARDKAAEVAALERAIFEHGSKAATPDTRPQPPCTRNKRHTRPRQRAHIYTLRTMQQRSTRPRQRPREALPALHRHKAASTRPRYRQRPRYTLAQVLRCSHAPPWPWQRQAQATQQAARTRATGASRWPPAHGLQRLRSWQGLAANAEAGRGPPAQTPPVMEFLGASLSTPCSGIFETLDTP